VSEVTEDVQPQLSDSDAALVDELRAALGDGVVEATTNLSNLVVRVTPEQRPHALAVLKAQGFTYYSFAGGVDWPDEERLEVLDHVEDLRGPRQVTVRCEVPRSNPRVPTATNVFRGADWHERETWELFGIVFVGHPKLRRLLLADWQEGFPMRKDEVLRPRIEKPWPGDFFSG
jgi:NADH-quinone oxidoreductase subunit C